MESCAFITKKIFTLVNVDMPQTHFEKEKPMTHRLNQTYDLLAQNKQNFEEKNNLVLVYILEILIFMSVLH